MSWYRTGTVAVTNGSTVVTGTGTMFAANNRTGDGFIGPDGKVYEVTNIPTETTISIAPAYLGTTASGQVYAISPMQGYVKASADRLRQATDDYGYKLENIGTMAEQNANAAAITGGNINGTTIGATTPAPLTASYIGAGVAADPAYSIKTNSPVLVNAASGQASVWLAQAGTNNGRIAATGGPGVRLSVEATSLLDLNGPSSISFSSSTIAP